MGWTKTVRKMRYTILEAKQKKKKETKTQVSSAR